MQLSPDTASATAALPPASTRESLFYPAPRSDTSLVGLPRLMETAFRGIDLGPERQALIDRARRDPHDANALLDLSFILFLMGCEDLALRMQAQALTIRRRYTLAATVNERLRMLTLMRPGSLMENIPVEFLLHGSDVTLEMVYVHPDALPAGNELPPHDVACIGVCASAASRPLLEALWRRLPSLPRPTINDPIRVLGTARETLWQLLRDAPGCLTPSSRAASRADLRDLAGGDIGLDELLPGAAYPIICRPQGSHAGHGLEQLGDGKAVAAYLAAASADDFVVSPFVDYRSADGQYRKYRIALIGGCAYPVHMALSARWMVHYLNGDMSDRPENRAEEQRFFDDFEHGFGLRHARALAAIDDRLGLDYFSIDCGETADGRLLVFECDTGGVAHAMDPLGDFGYKREHMLRLFAAFRALALMATWDPGCLKPKTAPATVQ